MSWRPENWKNPHPNTLMLAEGEYGYEVINLLESYTAYEAGADAMLEALKAKGTHTPTTYIKRKDKPFSEEIIIHPGYYTIILPEE